MRAASGTTSTDYRYTGQRNEAEIGLYYYVVRFFDPALGRFISADTVVPEPGNPIDWDRYAYANNNPIRYNDPSGHCVGPLLPVCVAVGTFIVDNAAAITAIATIGAVTSFITADTPRPELINDPEAAQREFTNDLFVSGLWLTSGLATLEFGNTMSELGTPLTNTNEIGEKRSIEPFLSQRNSLHDKTSGVLVVDGQEITLTSGWNGPASQMPQGSSGFNIVTRTHVEGHASALMQQNAWTSGKLYLNNLPCSSCSTLLPRMRPKNSTLQVIVLGRYDQLFKPE